MALALRSLALAEARIEWPALAVYSIVSLGSRFPVNLSISDDDDANLKQCVSADLRVRVRARVRAHLNQLWRLVEREKERLQIAAQI